ncbi:MAG: hypothetical protein LC772_02065 [Chloroflexi bacterium]|nr:hypothetical protein [Chloroflexota bacterium]
MPVQVTVWNDRGVVSQFSSRYEWLSGFAPHDDLAGRYSAVLDGSPTVPAQASLDLSSVPPPGAPGPALGLKYNFEAGWRFVRVAPQRTEDTVITGRPVALRLWLYSDGSGNAVRCRFTDSTGQTFQPTAPLPMSAAGWQWIRMPMNENGMGSWGGAGDGVIHLPIHWDSIFLVDNTGKAGSYETWISSPMLEYPVIRYSIF